MDLGGDSEEFDMIRAALADAAEQDRSVGFEPHWLHEALRNKQKRGLNTDVVINFTRKFCCVCWNNKS